MWETKGKESSLKRKAQEKNLEVGLTWEYEAAFEQKNDFEGEHRERLEVVRLTIPENSKATCTVYCECLDKWEN